MNNDIEILHVDCECMAPEHSFRLVVSKEMDMVCLEMQSYRWDSFFKLLVSAFKYVFCKKDLTWVSVLLKKEDVPKILEYLKRSE